MLRRALLSLLLTLPALFSNALAEGRPFRVVYADYRPYSWEQDAWVQGLEVEVANALLVDHLHLSVEYTVLPWERAQQYVKSGKADAMISTINAERAEYAWPSKVAVTYWQLSAFAKRGDARFSAGFESVDALRSYLLGAERGNRWITSHLPDAHVQFVDSMSTLPALLLAGRIDLITEDGMVVRDILATNPARDQIIEYPIPSSRSPMYFMLSKQSGFVDLRPRIDAALAEMEADGTLQRIQRRYQ